MKDIGDWLYFLIIIVAGISSSISSIRKKQQQAAKQQRNQTPPVKTQKRQPTVQPQRPQPGSQSRSIQQTISEKVRKAAARKPSIQTAHINNTKDGINIKPEDEGLSAITAEETAFLAPTYLQEEKAVFTIEDMPSNIDEWRKAFIYKEIFQRKY